LSGDGPVDKSTREPNAVGNIFNSEVGLFRTREGGLCRIIICGSQGEYLEAGRLRGEYAGYNWHNGRSDGFVGDAEGQRRFKRAIEKGLQTKKPALPRVLRRADTVVRTGISRTISLTPFFASETGGGCD